MQHQEYNKEPLQRYLLGDLDEEARIEIEARLLLDNDYNDQLLIVEDELIEDYDSGSLAPTQRDKFEKNYLPTPNGKRKVDIARALNSSTSTGPQAETPGILGSLRQILRAPLVRTPLGRAVAILLMAGLGLGTYWHIFRRTDTSQIASQTSALAKGVSTFQSIYYSRGRPFAARFSDLGYASISRTRGEREKSTEQKQAFGLLTLATQEEPGAPSYRNLGLYHLTQLAYDDAISELEKAVGYAPGSAQVHNDLAAAYLERGKSRIGDKDIGRGNEDLAKSSEHLAKALALNSSMSESLFNLALLHEAQLLPPEKIIEDWENYLLKDPNSGWAREARGHLENARQKKGKRTSLNKEQVLHNFLSAYDAFTKSVDEERRNKAKREAWDILSRNREVITGKVIWRQLAGGFLEASVSARSREANHLLGALEFAGELESARNDLYVTSLAEFYRSSSPSQRIAIAEAHREIDRGHSLFLKSSYADALARYRNAVSLSDGAGDNPGSLYARYWEGHLLSQSREPPENLENGRKRLLDLTRVFEDKKYLWLQAQSLTSLGGAYITQNQYSRGFECNSSAIRIFESLDDTFNLQRTLSLFADRHYLFGDYFGSLELSGRSLQLSDASSPGSRQIWRLYKSIAQTLTALGYYQAALDYQKEALKQAENPGGDLQPDPTLVFFSTAQLGAIYSKMGRYADAISQINYGLTNSGLDFNEVNGKEKKAYALLQMGHIHRQAGHLEESVSCYDQSIKMYESLFLQTYFYEAFKGRASSYLALGNFDQAEENLKAAHGLADYFRNSIVKENHKNTFFDAEQTIYDLYVGLEYERGKPQFAFDKLEHSRARSLLSALNSGHSPQRILRLTELQQRMPREAQIVEYAAMADKLIVWVVSKSDFNVIINSITYAHLREKIDIYFDLISRPSSGRDEEINQKSRELYDILVGPIEHLLDKSKAICIVPDKAINYVPFNALTSSRGEFLAASFRLIFSPSANVFVRCSENALQRKVAGEESLLIAGNPTFDRETYRLEPLPESETEAIKISALYKASPLIGDNAKEKSVRQMLARSNVIHFATHYIVDESDHSRSKLLLAKEPGESGPSDGILESGEIRRGELAKARLVVLSACRSGIERYYNGEGMIGMSRTFLAAGAPMVVASLWSVNSEATRDLMVRFHEYRKNNHYPTVEALRLAQSDMIQTRNQPPYFWAPFVLIGGYADF